MWGAAGRLGEEINGLFPWQRQLCECEQLICQREAVLSERTRHAESLAQTLEEYRTTTQERDAAGAGLSSPLCGMWPWEEAAREQRDFQGEPVCALGGSRAVSLRLSRRQEEEEEEESWVLVDPSSPLGTAHRELASGSSPESCQDVPEVRHALVPVVRDVVPVERPWAQHSPGLRVSRHLLAPTPILGLLLLLLSILLLSQSPTPTWPHLQLCYLQPPPV